MSPNLAPCPFCGSDRIVMCGHDGVRKTAPECWVACGDCGTTSNTTSFPERAIESWNRRSISVQTAATTLLQHWFKDDQNVELAKALEAWWRRGAGHDIAIKRELESLAKADLSTREGV